MSLINMLKKQPKAQTTRQPDRMSGFVPGRSRDYSSAHGGWQTPSQMPTMSSALGRIQLIRVLLFVVFAVFIVQLFRLQIIKHDYYVKAARSDQFREYDVLPERGIVSAKLGDTTVPVVVNQSLYNIVADPTIINDKPGAAKELADVLKVSEGDLLDKLNTENTRYVLLQRKVNEETSKKVLELGLPGVASQVRSYRVYPQGETLSQVLGFVNEDGNGVYGLEQAQNEVLKGKVGQLKAVTDVNGVPLPANSDNLSVRPEEGSDVNLTIDLGMQYQVEKMVKATQEEFRSQSVSAIVMETKTGVIKAMANYPTYNPSDYQKVSDASLFQNRAATLAIEPGSITKVLSVAAAVDSGAMRADQTFYDPGKWVIDTATITDVESERSTGTQDLVSTLGYSLNTGAVWAFMQMGGGKINSEARNKLYDYYVNHFNLSKETGIEQGYEATGYLPEPQDSGSGINLTYANMAFGQAYTASALQMVSAFNAIINGGTYYQPRLIDSYTMPDGTIQELRPKVLIDNVVSPKTSSDMVRILDKVTSERIKRGVSMVNFGPQYIAGTKSGTAQIANPAGGYREGVHNGSYIGFIGGDEPQYSVIVYNIEPNIPKDKFAGSYAAQPLFSEIVRMLIKNYNVTPKSQP